MSARSESVLVVVGISLPLTGWLLVTEHLIHRAIMIEWRHLEMIIILSVRARSTAVNDESLSVHLLLALRHRTT